VSFRLSVALNISTPAVLPLVLKLTPPHYRSEYRAFSSVEASSPTQYIIGHFRDDFYRPDDQTNSVKALKETS